MEMDRDELMTLILDHYESPRNSGEIENADAFHEGGNPGCGDIIKMYLKINDKNIVEDVKFEGEGCILSQAGASMMTENVMGKTVEEIEKMGPEAITDIIGTDLALTRPKCATLGLMTIKVAIKQWNRKKLLES